MAEENFGRLLIASVLFIGTVLTGVFKTDIFYHLFFAVGFFLMSIKVIWSYSKGK